ncbi:MAG: GNAT family N-acetyltransferase [Gammaproteobacteria bacterium]|nr:GNAT family N-acetyltransferase [Gammaproteobacteria bacterium]
MTVTIRRARREEQSDCLALIGLLRDEAVIEPWRRTFEHLLTEERGTVLVATDTETNLLGIATVSFNLAIRYGGEYAQLEELFVDPKARGKHVGALLVEAVIAASRERGCAEIGLYLLQHTAHNQPFYEKHGFEVIGAEMRQRL